MSIDIIFYSGITSFNVVSGQAVASDWTTYEYELTPAQVSNILSYASIDIQFRGTSGSLGGTKVLFVSWIEVEIPGVHSTILTPAGPVSVPQRVGDAQILRPDGDVATTTWAFDPEATAWECLDEVTPDDDSSYVYNDQDGNTNRCRVNMPAATAPGTKSGHFVRFRCKELTVGLGP